ncbi:MAG TPA: heme NO-binding domain-containing protein, partial [Saprospiraceae bacterium]|nr:heme NO-binding domain-containing protein [Saprospiraceae bacterium]
FHNRVMMMYPKLTPPEFKISNVEEHSLHLHYFSKRIGLTAFVYGLMTGLGKFFNTDVTTEHLESIPSESTHEILKVTWRQIQ